MTPIQINLRDTIILVRFRNGQVKTYGLESLCFIINVYPEIEELINNLDGSKPEHVILKNELKEIRL